jgi:DNA-binding beta-propeller fold protein YncE
MTVLGVTALAVPVAFAAQTAPFAYVADFGTPPTISVIDLATELVVATIPVDGDPYWAAVSRDGSVAAVSLHDDSGVALVDGRTNTLIDIVGGVGNEPEAVAVNSNGTKVYVADENPASSSDGDLYVVDVATRTVVEGPIDLSQFCDEPENAVISPDDRFVYISCASGSGSAIRVDTSDFSITLVAGDLDDAHGIALNCAGTRLYYGDGTDAFEYDTFTGAPTGTKFENCDFYGAGLSPDGRRLFCVEESNNVKIYDTNNGMLLDDVDLGDNNATAIAVHPDNSKAYIPISTADVVEVVDVELLQNLPGNITVGDAPRGIAIANCTQPNPVPAMHGRALVALAGLLLILGFLLVRPRHRITANN